MSHLISFLGLLLVLGIFSSPIFGQQSVPYTQDPLEQIKQKVERDEAILLDVRELSEWQRGHIQQAVLIPTSALRDKTQRLSMLDQLDKTKPIYCHCKAGGRAMVCGQLLKDLGYDIRPMKQSYKSIVAAGFVEVK